MSFVKVKVDVLGSLSVILIVCMVSVDMALTLNEKR